MTVAARSRSRSPRGEARMGTENGHAVVNFDAFAPLIVCGPSGVGKNTLIKQAMACFTQGSFGFSVSTTTRQPRPGEVDGTDYHFTTLETMKQHTEEGKFAEFATVHGNMYGTSKASLENVREQKRICILDVDIQGARLLKKELKHAHYIFLMPPSIEVLESRLRGRGDTSEESMLRRIKNAKEEMAFASEPGFFDPVLTADENFVKAMPQLRDRLAAWHPHLKTLD